MLLVQQAVFQGTDRLHPPRYEMLTIREIRRCRQRAIGTLPKSPQTSTLQADRWPHRSFIISEQSSTQQPSESESESCPRNPWWCWPRQFVNSQIPQIMVSTRSDLSKEVNSILTRHHHSADRREDTCRLTHSAHLRHKMACLLLAHLQYRPALQQPRRWSSGSNRQYALRHNNKRCGDRGFLV